MDADAEDPEPGAAVHRAVFYGLWPRFAPDDAERGDADAEAAGEPGADA